MILQTRGGALILRGGPEPCSRLVWFRTLSLHAPPPVNECRSTYVWEPGGPDLLLTFSFVATEYLRVVQSGGGPSS